MTDERSSDLTNPGGEAQCDHCGRCLSVCPVYKLSRVETDSPRGRNDLLSAVQSGELTPGPRFDEIIKRCLLCKSCTTACPKGVDAASRVIAARCASQRPVRARIEAASARKEHPAGVQHESRATPGEPKAPDAHGGPQSALPSDAHGAEKPGVSRAAMGDHNGGIARDASHSEKQETTPVASDFRNVAEAGKQGVARTAKDACDTREDQYVGKTGESSEVMDVHNASDAGRQAGDHAALTVRDADKAGTQSGLSADQDNHGVLDAARQGEFQTALDAHDDRDARDARDAHDTRNARDARDAHDAHDASRAEKRDAALTAMDAREGYNAKSANSQDIPPIDKNSIEELVPHNQGDAFAQLEGRPINPAPPRTASRPGADAFAQLEGRSRSLSERLAGAAMDVLIPRRGLMSACVRFAGLATRMLPADELGRRHAPEYIPGIFAGRAAPVVSGRPLQRRLPARAPRDAGTPNRGEVLFFTGCYYGLIEVGPGLAAVRALTAQGFDVLLPPGQQCCGAPALFSGREKGFLAVLRANLKAFGQTTGPILSACPTCASMLRGEYPAQAARLDLPEAEEAARLAGRVRELMTFLADLDRLSLPDAAPNFHSAAVHQPCHWVHAGGDPEAVARLLASRGVEVVLDRATGCCGGGGVSSFKNPDIARALGTDAASILAASGADVALAGCPGCVLQLGGHLGSLRRPMPALHPIELFVRI